jgi:hypothetical protein
MTGLKPMMEKAGSQVRRDVVPQSADHTARLVLGGLAVAAACFKYVSHKGVWSREDVIAAALFLLGGLGVVFTGSVVALLKAVPVPWRKGNGDAPPPPAEAA